MNNSNKKYLVIGIFFIVVVVVLGFVYLFATNDSSNDKPKINNDLVKKFDDNDKDPTKVENEANNDKKSTNEYNKDFNNISPQNTAGNMNEKSNDRNKGNGNLDLKDKGKKTDKIKKSGKKEVNKDKESLENIDKSNDSEEKPITGNIMPIDQDNKNKSNIDISLYSQDPKLGQVIDGWYIWDTMFSNIDEAMDFGGKLILDPGYVKMGSRMYSIREFQVRNIYYKNGKQAGSIVKFMLGKEIDNKN